MSFCAERLKNIDGNVFYPVTHSNCSFVNWKGETDFSAYTDSAGNSKTYKDKYVDIVTDMSSIWYKQGYTYLGYVRWILDTDNSPTELRELRSYVQAVNNLTALLNKTKGFPDYVALSQVSVKHLSDATPKLDLSDFDNDVELTEISNMDTGEEYFTAALKDTKTADYSGANFGYGKLAGQGDKQFIGAHNCVFLSSSDGTATLSFYNGNETDNKVVAKLDLTKITT